MLPPLTPGEHTVEFRGAVGAADLGAMWFEVGVTSGLTVEQTAAWGVAG